jgi:glycosyltransferase involved in cell wall biosynthesis
VRVVVTTPYPEASTIAIGRSAAEAEALERFHISGLPRWIESNMPIRHRVADLGLPAERLQRHGGVPELARGLIARVPGMEPLSSRTMYAAKVAFDRDVADALRPCDAAVGVYASCALTLRRARTSGALAVLNFVNSHPKDHNRYLSEIGGLVDNHHELVPAGITSRVERELEYADIVLVPSTFLEAQLLERGVPASRIALHGYAVDLTAFSPSMERRDGPPRCLYAGQISHRKGIPFLLRAASRAGDVDVLMTGPIVSREVLRDMPANVRLLGTLSHQGIADMMRASDIFVLPSLEDSYGLVVLEAMASALPVVVTTNVGASEIVENGVSGLIVPVGDDRALADAIGRLAADPELRVRMGRAARERVVGGRSWSDYGRAVMKDIATALQAR